MDETILNKLNHEAITEQELYVNQEQIIRKETLQAYNEALTYSNLKLNEQIFTRNVKIYQKDHLHEIYTQNKHLPHIVMLHGFGGSALTNIRTFQLLKDYYQIHAIDMFGVGFSSLGNYTENFTQEQVKHYHVDALEEWRKKLKIQSFTFAGHSYGGYLAVLYAQKYPQRINRLILLSPAGATSKTKEQINAEIQRRKNISFYSRFFMCIAQFIYNRNFRPSKVMGSWIIGNALIQRITSGRLNLKDKEKQAWKKYLKALSTQNQSSSQTGFYKLFEWPVSPKQSIEQIMRNNQFQFTIEFYFGDIDWMDRKGAQKLGNQKKNIIFEIIENAGHQLIFDNPRGVCAKILRADRTDKKSRNQKSEQISFNNNEYVYKKIPPETT